MLTETDRRARYAAQAGADPGTWACTGPQLRRIRRKNGHAASAGTRSAAAQARAQYAAARPARLDDLGRGLLGILPVPRARATLAARRGPSGHG